MVIDQDAFFGTLIECLYVAVLAQRPKPRSDFQRSNFGFLIKILQVAALAQRLTWFIAGLNPKP